MFIYICISSKLLHSFFFFYLLLILINNFALKAMFLSKLAESRQNIVTLQGVDPEMVKLLLDYAYSSHVLITRSNVQSLLSAANLLQVSK